MNYQTTSTLLVIAASLLVGCSGELEGTSSRDDAAGESGSIAIEKIDGQSKALGAGDSGNCAEEETLCDGLDDDCNGKIDDVDVGADGFCDCLQVGILGAAGSRESDTFQLWLSERGSKVERFSGVEEEEEGLTAVSAGDFDVVLLDWVQADYSEQDAQALADFVEAGGGVISLTGYANDYIDTERHNQLLKGLGAGYDETSSYFDSWTQTFFEHPLSENVDQVAFLGGLPVFGPDQAEVFAESSFGSPVGLAFDHGQGRALIWGDEWITFDSEWSSLPGVENFWRNAMSYLGPKHSCQVPQPVVK